MRESERERERERGGSAIERVFLYTRTRGH